MSKRFLSIFLIGLGILAVTITTIMVAKGYRFDRRTGSIKGTGIISVASIPSGAVIYLDGDLVSASNNTINDLEPKSYKIKVSKDGFSSWEKTLTVEAEKVTLVNVTLFPTTPDLRPITFTGLTSPQLSPDGQRIVYAISAGNKAGLWVLDITVRPFAFSRDPKMIAKDLPTFTYSKAIFSWAPDSKSVLVTGKNSLGKSAAYLLSSDSNNESATDIATTLEQTKAIWQTDQDLKNKDRLNAIPTPTQADIANSAKVRWSPDDLKVAYEKGSEIQIYDVKKTKLNSTTKSKEFFWYPDSDHLILADEGAINIVEIDGSNRTPIYAGAFENNLVFPWPDGSRILIMASFNKAAGSNLYSINLR